jgi:hypothetical protein
MMKNEEEAPSTDRIGAEYRRIRLRDARIFGYTGVVDPRSLSSTRGACRRPEEPVVDPRSLHVQTQNQDGNHGPRGYS